MGEGLKFRNVDPDVAEARAVLANLTRNRPDDAEAIAAARFSLEAAKHSNRLRRAAAVRQDVADRQQVLNDEAAQLRREAAALLDNPSDRSHPWISGGIRITTVHHRELYAAEVRASDAFKAHHGNSRLWSPSIQIEWERLIQRSRDAHRALGCSPDAYCTGAANRG